MVQVLNRNSNETVPDRAQRKSEAKRLEILRAAARVFRRLGLSATGMREIAQEADLSPGNLYYYFAGKDEILLFCQERTLDRLLAEAARASTAAVAYRDRLRALMSAHVHCMLDDLEGTTAHLEVEGLPERMRRGVIAKRDAYEHAVRELVAAGMKRGEFAQGRRVARHARHARRGQLDRALVPARRCAIGRRDRRCALRLPGARTARARRK